MYTVGNIVRLAPISTKPKGGVLMRGDPQLRYCRMHSQSRRVITLSETLSLLISLAFRDLIDVDAKYVYFFHKKIPSRFVFSSSVWTPFTWGAGNSSSPLRLAFSTNPLRLIPNDSSHFAHMMHRRQFPVMSIPPRSGTSLPRPVASYSVHQNTGAKRREQRKLGKGETLNIGYTSRCQ